MKENYLVEKFGHQRDWVWRGWQIRYSYLKPPFSPNTEKPPILLIHGFGASLHHWRFNISVLAEEYPVYAIDLLGFGASRKADTEYNTQLWTELIYDFWQTFINQPMIMVGNSLGSLICVVTAYNYPKIVKKITLLNLPDVTIRQEMIPKIVQPIIKIIETIFSDPIFLKPLFLILRQPSILKKCLSMAYIDQSKIDQELINIIAIPPQDENAIKAFIGLCRGVNNVNFAPSMKQILPQLNIPILLIWGLKDCMIPSSLASIFAQLNAKIELVTLENVGHCPQDEIPEKFNQILLNYCKI